MYIFFLFLFTANVFFVAGIVKVFLDFYRFEQKRYLLLRTKVSLKDSTGSKVDTVF